MTGATVAFDPSTGIYRVTGAFDMRLDYDSRGSHYQDRSFTRAYSADLVWYGSALQAITINGAS